MKELNHHISRRFNKDLEDLRNSVLAMGGLVETQLTKAIEAVVSGNSELGLQVAHDDYKVNRFEVNIDEECSRILATRGPTASDLRLIVAIIKTITDLERIGDEAEKIGFLASKLANMDRPADSYRELKTLGSQVKQMLHSAMDAFARLDAEAALNTVREDEFVDEEYERIQRQCITFMMEDPRTIKRVMNVTWAARSLERIGDHSKNICEYVIFMVYGKDVRHTNVDDVENNVIRGEES
ncbi:MAG: phosphate signaling complex protein PhoU [Pseudomonadota bacterium]